MGQKSWDALSHFLGLGQFDSEEHPKRQLFSGKKERKRNPMEITKTIDSTLSIARLSRLPKLLYALASDSGCVSNVCEVGFNGGHSAAMWLHANPSANVYSFDMFDYDWATLGVRWLQNDMATMFGYTKVGERLHAIHGNSTNSVPRFHMNQQVRCDLIFIDGGYDSNTVAEDLANFKFLANPKFHVGVITQTNCWGELCHAKRSAFTEHLKRGNLVELEGLRENKTSGLSLFQYKF